MRSTIPKCRFNALGRPIFGLILTSGAFILLTLGKPGTVRAGDAALAAAKPLDRAPAPGPSMGDAGGRLVEGDFGMRPLTIAFNEKIQGFGFSILEQIPACTPG